MTPNPHRHACQPTGLAVDLAAHGPGAIIRSRIPRFSWIVGTEGEPTFQHGSQIQVATTKGLLAEDRADMWDSGPADSGSSWTTDSRSIAVPYAGPPLASESVYFFRVRIWTSASTVSPWSEIAEFRTGVLKDEYAPAAYQPMVAEEAPQAVVRTGPEVTFIDFGKAAFGTVALEIESPRDARCEVRLGEVLRSRYEIEPEPGGARRFMRIPLTLTEGRHRYQVRIPSDERNTGPLAIRMPKELFEVCPFRYCEVVGASVEHGSIRRLSLHYPFDEEAAWFRSSNTVLNHVWELCRYTMKATSFIGYYVDGDRERIPYEADAYINQLGHYAVDRELTMARRTHEYLILHPTWPTEWHLFSVLVAWNDYMFSGDDRSIRLYYDDLVAKSLMALGREDGLISTRTGLMTEEVEEALHYLGSAKDFFGRGIDDIVDWPQGERDEFEMKPVNAVVNALHVRALHALADIAAALEKSDDEAAFRRRAALASRSYAAVFIDGETGLVRDGEDTAHSSLHANAFALAAGLVPPESLPRVLAFLRSKGMACSVYASQLLMEGLYAGGDGEHALSLLTSRAERSWSHMAYDVGTTVALEAWDDRFKPNQDWNHAWGAAPANLIPHGLMGIRPISPGFEKILIQPQPGSLEWAEVRTPTIRGPVMARFSNRPDRFFHLEIEIPGNATARVVLPDYGHSTVTVDGRIVAAPKVSALGDWPRSIARGVLIDGVPAGRHTISLSANPSADPAH